tara:strand:- start:6252 stop:6596 length:345 start_codon:yes stop_codon:yes gene_type:complete
MSILFDSSHIVSRDGSSNIEPYITFYGEHNVKLIKNIDQQIEKLEKQVEFEMGQKVKARNQRNDYVKEVEKCLSEYQARIEELETALAEISRVANYPPRDKSISELAREALKIK